MHGLNRSLGGIIPLGNSWLVPSRNFLKQILPRLGSKYAQYTVPDSGSITIDGKDVYCVNELFGVIPGFINDLRNLVCVLLINCSADEKVTKKLPDGRIVEEYPDSTEVFPMGSIAMVDELTMCYPIYQNGVQVGWEYGANFAGTIVGRPPEQFFSLQELKGAMIPAVIANAGAQKFWQEVYNGTSFDEALQLAAKEMTERLDKGKYEKLESRFGKQEFYGYYRYRRCCWYGYLRINGKPWGGRTEEELKIMGPVP